MATLSKSDVVTALTRLGELAHAQKQNEVWLSVEPHLQPGRELKAKYAFDDLWEESHGSDGTIG